MAGRAAGGDCVTSPAEIFAQPWFWPALAVVVGLPVVLLVLGEVHSSLVRRESPGAKLVLLIRNVLAPLVAILLLFAMIPQANGVQVTWAKVVATLVGFVVLLVLLGGLNLAVFVTAKHGTWRQRFPTIFVDVARVVLVIVGVAILFGWIWGADVGGVFAALGVTSIIIGLALQDSVGAVLSGLFLLFERPFEVGDYILSSEGKGRIIEITWRATYLDTGNGILVIPNAQLAGTSFENLTRASSPYEASDVVRFASDDPPQKVMQVLIEVASGLPARHPDAEPSAVPLDKAKFEINIPLTDPAKQYTTLGLFRTRLWYAARRAGLHLDRDLTDAFATPERVRAEVARFGARMRLGADEVSALGETARLERYGAGETLQRAGTVPDALRVIVEGVVELRVPVVDGAVVPLAQLRAGELLGLTAPTRQPVAAVAVAVGDVAVLVLPADAVRVLVDAHPTLARDIGAELDARRTLAERALDAAGFHLDDVLVPSGRADLAVVA